MEASNVVSDNGELVEPIVRCLQLRNVRSETASSHLKRENIALICERNENRVHSPVRIMQNLRGQGFSVEIVRANSRKYAA